MYEARAYRSVSRPSDLVCYEVAYKETDLFCCTSVDVKRTIEMRVLAYRSQLETYIRQRPEFVESFTPIQADFLAPRIAKEMIEASAAVGVGPMACVAGAIAESVGRDIDALSDEYILENGGDICIKTRYPRRVMIYAKDSPYSNRIGINLRPEETAYGVCTSSGTVGHSLSLGRADAVCVVGRSALFCDGLATRVGNLVNKEDDISGAIEEAKMFPGVTGLVIVMGKTLGIWGDLDLIKP
jgi:ApbE superfamily uncharacterized protein (UPF0280 family)